MSNQRIVDTLTALFSTQSIVFWHDSDAAFAEEVSDLPLGDVKLIRMDKTPALRIKLDIERGDTQAKWLLYSPLPEPAVDWLLDIRLRARSFNADVTSMLMDDLGLASQVLRTHLKARARFLADKKRVERLKRWVVPLDTAPDLDRKMLAVLSRADQPDFFSILFKLFGAFIREDEVDLNTIPKIWQDITTNELGTAFWVLAKQDMGYKEAEPSLRDFLFRILVTDFCRSLTSMPPESLRHFVLNDKAVAANPVVFAARWRSDMGNYTSYNRLSSAVAKELNLSSVLAQIPADDLVESMTFEETEQRILKDLKDRIMVGAGTNMERVFAIIARRRDGHWANRILAQANPAAKAFVAGYDALESAAHFLALKSEHQAGFSFASAKIGLANYQTKLFLFDQFYRRFNYAADVVEPMGWAVLHELRALIEAGYSGWFVPHLASAWDKVMGGDDGLLATWRIEGMTNQQNFFNRKVQPLFDSGIKRVFVVISDALRFEVAEELARELNSKNRLKTTLGSQLGVLPSYTALGMASLLPHTTMAYKFNQNLDVMVDDQPVATQDQRNAQLNKFGGLAIKAEDLLALGKEKGRALVRDARLVYVYHDRIDMIGDKGGSETKTFEAAAAAMIDLSQLVSFIINSLNGSTLLITADHGFMYQESALDAADKSKLEEKPAGALKTKKRYILGENMGLNSKAWCSDTALTAGTRPEASLDFWVPKGAGRFHFSGGARFVHGSAMPQEILVPIITVNENESAHSKTKFVEFSLLGSSNKIVTNTQRFEFIQIEPVSDRILPRTVLISLRDGDVLISDEQKLTFDSTASSLDDRKRSIFITVLMGVFDRNRDFFLIARDVNTKIELLRIPVKVDLAFTNDF